MLEANDLECARGERRLFAGLHIAIDAHTLLTVRGPNGSGKSTLLRTLCGLFHQAAGSVTWQGAEIRSLGEEYRAHVAYLGHLNAVNEDLNAVQNLQYATGLAAVATDRTQSEEALSWFGLGPFLAQPCKTLSQGQRRRVALARLRLSNARKLWILDEPFAALDSAAIGLMQSLVNTHLDAGGMVILTTHQEVPLSARNEQQIELGS